MAVQPPTTAVVRLITLGTFESTYLQFSFYTLEFNYCRVERNRTGDVATPIARRDHRKSKFGLR